MDQPTINDNSKSGSQNQESTPFEMPSNVSAPEPMGQKPQNPITSSQNRAAAPPATPSNLEPSGSHKPFFSYIIILFLVILLVAAILLFAAWKGWISLGGIFKEKATPTPSASITISPAISSILPSVSPTATSSAQTTTNVNDEIRKKDLANIQDALQKYYAGKSEYPKSITTIKTSDKTSVLYQALVSTYIEALPDDPMAPQFYYGYNSDGQTGELTAVLEDKSDPSGTLTGPINIYKVLLKNKQ